ncbi:MAG TPA: hypothetical protein VGY56_11055 [Verrucomicrobiae bacterium]|nr:hypothetical protein [Verrucomicrobiae bacterium]
MKSLIEILAVLIVCSQIALADEVQQFPLDEFRVYQIPVSTNRVTTVSFPGPISAIEAANVTVDGTTPGQFQIAYVQGSYFFSVRALATNAVTNVNIRWNDQTYALELLESNEPDYSVIFEQTDDRAAPPMSVAVTPEHLLALLDTAKAYPLLKEFHPEAVANVEYANYAKKPPMDYKTYAVKIDEAFRFTPEDTLIFRLTLTNRTSQILRYSPDGFSLRVGERLYPQSISDAAGVIPPHGTAPAYFAVTGTPDGGRNDISLKNDFIVILQAFPDDIANVNPVAPTNSIPVPHSIKPRSP